MSLLSEGSCEDVTEVYGLAILLGVLGTMIKKKKRIVQNLYI